MTAACLCAGRHDIPGQQKHRKQNQPKQCVRNDKSTNKKAKASSFSEPFAIFMIYFVHLGWNKLRENRAVLLLKQ